MDSEAASAADPDPKRARTASLTEVLRAEHQLHLLDLLPALSSDPSHPVLAQLTKLDIPAARRLLRRSLEAGSGPLPQFEPVRASLKLDALDSDSRGEIRRLGVDAIRRGSVGVVILSGGQGTRLGFNGPKGMFNLGMPSAKTIFQYHMERVSSRSSLLAEHSKTVKIPVYIMTSDLNDAVIRSCFEEHHFFGYPKDQLFFFQQDLMPCMTPEGDLILESERSLAMAPCGNGGIFAALESSGAVGDMLSRGVEHLHVFAVDNVLTKPADPEFIGHCIQREAECGNKVVWRRDKSEKVGVTVESEGRFRVVEYSDLPSSMAEAEDNQGRLVFGAANICNHYFSLDFIRTKVIGQPLAFHVARKKIPYLDKETRKTVTPTSNNGIKLELFIFDVFPLAERWTVVEVLREDEFAPVKNEPGNPVDSPDTARALMSSLFKRWLEKAGAHVVSTSSDSLCEISWRRSYEGEGLESHSGLKIELPCYLE